MGRPKKFDVDSALDAATEVFWQKGYAETSIVDLEERLNLGRQSIYGAFGDKRELFMKTLDRYAARQPASREVMRQDGAGLAEIRQFMDGVVDFLGSARGLPCYLVSAALSEDDDPEVAVRCGRNQADLADAFTHALRGAQARGEIDATTDVAGKALMLASQVFGLNVMTRNGTDVDTLRVVAWAAVDSLG
jgi:AcrR family transcriptional regulator